MAANHHSVFPSLELRFFWPAPQGQGKRMSFRMVDPSSK